MQKKKLKCFLLFDNCPGEMVYVLFVLTAHGKINVMNVWKEMGKSKH